MEIPCVVWCCQYMQGGDVYNVSTFRVVLSELHCVSLPADKGLLVSFETNATIMQSSW
jgi:hypothetical protein